MLRSTLRSAAVLLTLCLLACLAATVQGGKDDLPNPSWDRVCTSPFSTCATVEVYRQWGERPGDRLHMSVNAMMSDPNNKGTLTAWVLMDEPDVEFAKELSRAQLNVVLVYPRGTKLSKTHYTCPDAAASSHNAQCWLSEKCAAELATTKDEMLNATHFTVDQAAHDLEWLLRTLGDGRPNVVVAQGLSSIVALRLLQLHPQVPVGVLLFDYIHPLLLDTYGYLAGEGHDIALQHLLALCDDDVLCVGRLGAVEGTWNRLQTLMRLAKAKKLTCAKELKWGSSKELGSSFAEQLRSVVTLMLRYPTYPFVSSKRDLTALIPSMLYRLQRCSKKDVEALNTLYKYVTGTKGFACPDDVSLQMHWLKNEFVQTPAPKNVPKYWGSQSDMRLVLPPVSSINTFHAASTKFPSVGRSAAAQVLPVNATQKVLLIGADVDPLAPRGASSQLALAFRKYADSVKTVSLRGIGNQPALHLAPCITENLKAYKSRSDWADAAQCTTDPTKRVDFLSGPTMDFYGVADGWDYDFPNSDDGSSRGGGRGGEKGSGSVVKTLFRVLLILVLLAAAGAGAFYGYKVLRDRGFRYNRVSDNFYDNLQT